MTSGVRSIRARAGAAIVVLLACAHVPDPGEIADMCLIATDRPMIDHEIRRDLRTVLVALPPRDDAAREAALERFVRDDVAQWPARGQVELHQTLLDRIDVLEQGAAARGQSNARLLETNACYVDLLDIYRASSRVRQDYAVR